MIRQQIIQKRKLLDKTLINKAKYQALNLLIDYLFTTFTINFNKQKKHFENLTIAIYIDFINEVPTKQIINYFQEHNIICAPIISDESNMQMHIMSHKSLKNSFGIYEPTKDSPIIDNIDIIIVPIVAFDSNNNRLGFGKGFYDKYIDSLHQKEIFPKLIGLAYDFQEINHIEKKPWDKVLDKIIIIKTN